MKYFFGFLILSFSLFAITPKTPAKKNQIKKTVEMKSALPEEFKVDTTKPCDKPKPIVIEPKKPMLGSGGCKVE